MLVDLITLIGSPMSGTDLILRLLTAFMLVGLLLGVLSVVVPAVFGIVIGGTIGLAWATLLYVVLIPGAVAVGRGWAALLLVAGAAALYFVLQRQVAGPELTQIVVPAAVVVVGLGAGMLAEFWARSWEALFELVRIASPLGVGVLWLSDRVEQHTWPFWAGAAAAALLLSHLAVMLFRRRAGTLAWRRRRFDSVQASARLYDSAPASIANATHRRGR